MELNDIIAKVDEADKMLRGEITAAKGNTLPGAQNRQIALMTARTFLQNAITSLMQVPPLPQPTEAKKP